MAPPEVIALSMGWPICLATLSVKDVEDMFVFLDESITVPLLQLHGSHHLLSHCTREMSLLILYPENHVFVMRHHAWRKLCVLCRIQSDCS